MEVHIQVDIVGYAYVMTQNTALEKLINLDTMVLSIVKIIDLEAEVFAKKTIVALVFEIDGDGIHMKMVLIDQDTTVLLQTIVLGSEI